MSIYEDQQDLNVHQVVHDWDKEIKGELAVAIAIRKCAARAKSM